MAGLVDRNFNQFRKRKYYTPYDMLSVVGGGTDDIVVAHTTAALFTELTAATQIGIAGLDVSSAGELIVGMIPCPYDMDPKFPVGFKIAFCVDANGSSTVEWIILQATVADGIALAIPSAALDTVIVDKAVGSTDNLLSWTSRGIRNVLGLTRPQIEAGAFLTFSIENQAVTNLTAVFYLGLMMDYVQQTCQGIGSESDRPLISA